MLEELKKSLDKGIEYAFATRDKLTKAAQDLAKENKLTKEEAKKLLDHLVKKSEETRQGVEAQMQEFLKTSLKKMNIPSADDLKKLELRIGKLEGKGKAPVKPKVVKKAKPAARKTS
jgi:polyhydroxyalkanoate synthesis regulator phasin